MADEALLNEVRAAAEAALEARANGEASEEASRRALLAVHAALDGGHSVSAICAAESEGQRAARERSAAQVLRAVERAAKKLRDATDEYERTVAQAVELGLAARDIAARAGVSHGTVAAVARRHEQAKPAPPQAAARESERAGSEAEPAAEGEPGSPVEGGPPAAG